MGQRIGSAKTTKSCKALVKGLIRMAIFDNLAASVNDGENWVIKCSEDIKKIMGALYITKDAGASGLPPRMKKATWSG